MTRIDFTFWRRLLRSTVLLFIFLLLGSLCQVRISCAQEAAITDYTVSNSESHLLLYLTVTNWFNADMEAAVHNGIPVTFAFYIDLFEKRPNWPDKKIREYEFNHVMEYDSLKKEYVIRRNEKGDSRVAASLEEAKRLMSEINGFRVLPLDALAPRSSYTLRSKAKLARKTMPQSFHYLVPFSSPWDFETKWHALTLKLAQ